MKTYTIEFTTKRFLKVTANHEQEAMGKAYQMVMQLKPADVEPAPGLNMSIELKDEMA